MHGLRPQVHADTETMTDNTTTDSDVVEQQHSGASIKAKLKRGTGTRDQDTIVIKGKGTDAEEAIENFQDCLDAAWEREWGYQLRGFQAECGGEGDE
jgi:phosphotransferase system HPr-like phosphotransfer protein